MLAERRVQHVRALVGQAGEVRSLVDAGIHHHVLREPLIDRPLAVDRLDVAGEGEARGVRRGADAIEHQSAEFILIDQIPGIAGDDLVGSFPERHLE